MRTSPIPRRRRASDPPVPRVKIMAALPQEVFDSLNQKAAELNYSRSAIAAMAIAAGLPLLTTNP